MEKKKLKRSAWLPVVMFCAGLAFYVYYGITWHAWMRNLPNIIIYAGIVTALWWALKKKEELADKRYIKAH